MRLLADELRKGGATIIDNGNRSMDIYKDGKLVKRIKVREEKLG